jgi:hypothetical protein
MSTFVPKDPETLVGFDNILAEYNEITGINTVFTDDYMMHQDIYIGTDTTRDGYEVHTIAYRNENVVLGENVFMYKPDAYEIFNAINDSGCYDKCIVYLEDFNDYMSDLEYYMLEELNTNFINYIDENQLKD